MPAWLWWIIGIVIGVPLTYAAGWIALIAWASRGGRNPFL